MSVEQYAATPQDEGVDHELVQGELIELSSATPEHAWVRDELRVAVREFLRRSAIGVAIVEVDCRTEADIVRRPDISYFGKERWSLIDVNRVPIPFAPDIAVEVLSPSEKAIDVNRRISEYLAAGSQEVWIVDTDNSQILIHTASGMRHLGVGERLESAQLPGFSIAVTEVLAPPNAQ